ncbi:hypothetical protein [Streptomyces sp. NPDC057325]|uniref:hypothetical protein n=1 Tax=unclassified Streptomyces TaxID=2593676 RepID=UPI00362DBD14
MPNPHWPVRQPLRCGTANAQETKVRTSRRTRTPDHHSHQLTYGFRPPHAKDSGNPRAFSHTDSKASLLLAFDGAALADLAGLADKPFPLSTRIAGGATVLTPATAAVLLLLLLLLLLVVRPNFGGRRTVREGCPAGRTTSLPAPMTKRDRRKDRDVGGQF